MSNSEPALDRPKILCVAVHVPVPGDTGDAVRINAMLASLSKHYRIDFICGERNGTTDLHVAALKELIPGNAHVHRRQVRAWRRNSVGRWTEALVRREPPWMTNHRSPTIQRVISRTSSDYSAVVFLDNAAALYRPAVGRTVPTVVDVHNVAGRSVESGLGTDCRLIPNAKRRLLATLVRSWEERTLTGADEIVVTSDLESHRLLDLYGIRASAIIPSGCYPAATSVRASGSRNIGFLGSLHYPPNRDGLVRFLACAWQRLAKEGCRLLVAGSLPPDLDKQLATIEGVDALGFVPDLGQFMQRLDVAIVPIWAGAGVKLKTAAFLGAGIPVVTTSVGAEGLQIKDNVHALIRETPEELGAALHQLLGNEARAQMLSSNGLGLVRRDLDWDLLGTEFAAVVRRAIPRGVRG